MFTLKLTEDEIDRIGAALADRAIEAERALREHRSSLTAAMVASIQAGIDKSRALADKIDAQMDVQS